MDRARNALPPGVLSMHVLPAEHHDRDWDAIIVPKEVKERLLSQALVDDWRAFQARSVADNTFFGASNYYTYLARRPE